MKKKIALITGAPGQAGVYLSRFLLKKKYVVVATSRVISHNKLWRFRKLDILKDKNLIFENLDITDSKSIYKIIKKYKFNEIYNLAAKSSPRLSFKFPISTSEVNAIAVLKILETIRKYSPSSKFYQASTAGIFGQPLISPQTEDTPLKPTNPYATSKAYAHNLIENYRDSYGLFTCSGIMYSLESPLRSNEFVTKKIINNLVLIKKNKKILFELGNLNAVRDFGYVDDFVRAMWLMLQKKKPGDYIISTNKTCSVKKFIEITCKELKIKLKWVGKGLNICGLNQKTNKIIIRINKNYFRPIDVNYLQGNYNKAKKHLKWKPKFSLKDLIRIMIKFEIQNT